MGQDIIMIRWKSTANHSHTYMANEQGRLSMRTLRRRIQKKCQASRNNFATLEMKKRGRIEKKKKKQVL